MGDAPWRLPARALVLVAALACRTTYYDEYKAAHPGFDPVLPRDGATLEEVLAAIHAPDGSEQIHVEVARLAIFRTDVSPWREVSFDSIRREGLRAEPGADYAVLVGWACRFDQGLQTGGTERGGYYLLPGDRLAAYDHYAFREGCSVSNDFRAARGPLVATEVEAFERVGPWGRRLTLSQAYRRGLAYVEAGRLQEARAMLVIGERGYRATAGRPGALGGSDALAEVERLRGALMRALGVEARKQSLP